MKNYTASLEEHDPFYAANESASDFIYSQDCPAGGYQEIYFNPDCVLLQEAERDIYWFDLGYSWEIARTGSSESIKLIGTPIVFTMVSLILIYFGRGHDPDAEGY